MADLNDPAYWRARAEEARQYAETFTDEGAHRSMLTVVEIYENLAKLAEKILLVRDVRPKRVRTAQVPAPLSHRKDA